tara:strand:- start:440 stop:724 length:285 start_codon:yes stop_codon:yes gene_type:complete
MRESKIKKIGHLISDFIDKNKSDNNTSSLNAFKLWKDLMGNSIMSVTKKVYSNNNVLYVEINNPYLRTDLKYQKNNILKKIQDLYPDIQDIIIS